MTQNFISHTLAQSRTMTPKAIEVVGKKNRCPRCGRDKILDRNEMIQCIACGLEFDKSDLERFKNEDILAISEKQGIIKVLLDELSID